MTIEQAMQNVRAVCAAFQGNLAQHETLQGSLATIRTALKDMADALPVVVRPDRPVRRPGDSLAAIYFESMWDAEWREDRVGDVGILKHASDGRVVGFKLYMMEAAHGADNRSDPESARPESAGGAPADLPPE